MQETAHAIPARVVAATVAGNALEFFDFVTYAFFAVYIGDAFFPASTPFASLLLSVAVFGVGFVSRPLGGYFIGALADRSGRRTALLLTIGMITVGTLGLALTPPYSSIGIAAPLIVVACRLVQGLALGGDVGPASAFLIEAAPAHKRGLYASWQSASQGLSAFVAGAIGFGMSLALPKDQLASWGWRVPFLFSVTLIPVAIYLRRSMPETHAKAANQPGGTEHLLWDHRWNVVLSVLIIMGGTISTYVGAYMTTYATSTLHLPASISVAATLVGGAAGFFAALLGGWMSDRFGRRPVMLWPRIVLTLAVVPCFVLMNHAPGAASLFFASLVVTGLTSISAAAALVLIPEILPRAIRARGLGVAYAVGVSVFGGTTQFVITALIGWTHDPIAPAWYVVVTGILSILAIFGMPETRGREPA